MEVTNWNWHQCQPRVIDFKRAHLISEVARKLLAKGAIKIVSPFHDQFLSRIFVVPKKDGSHRPVINLKPLNQFMRNTHFKMENQGTMRDLLRKDDWMASIDVYLSVAVWKIPPLYVAGDHVQIPASSLRSVQCSQSFTKLLKSKARACVIMYLDDMLLMAQSRDELER